jgi:hypothetical protein
MQGVRGTFLELLATLRRIKTSRMGFPPDAHFLIGTLFNTLEPYIKTDIVTGPSGWESLTMRFQNEKFIFRHP